MKKNIAGVIGLLLIIGTLAGGIERLRLLVDWSTPEIVGYNISTLMLLSGGAWLLYYGLSNRKSS